MLRRPLTPDEDAFGHLLRDLLAGRRVVEVVERDDGCVFTGEPNYFVAPFRSWWPRERRAMRFVRGRVLDVGCGAGPVGLSASRPPRGERQGRRLLRKLARRATGRGRILAGSYDPYRDASELTRRYRRRTVNVAEWAASSGSVSASTKAPGTSRCSSDPPNN